jgi:fucose permease
MSFALIRLDSWNYGYLIVSILQVLLSIIIITSLPLWNPKDRNGDQSEEIRSKALSFREIFAIKGAIPCFCMFFCYCALELTTSLWASTYLVQRWELAPETAAGFASMFYIGLTFGRFVNGFLAMKNSDRFLIRMGGAIITVGVLMLCIPLHSTFALIGFIVIGLGCAPIYPCIIHMTPDVFGKDKSQAMIGVQMAFAYIGFLLIPPLFGIIVEHLSVALLPIYIGVFLLLMCLLHEIVLRRAKKS